MNELVPSGVVLALKMQILYVPIVLFYLICSIKRMPPAFRWIVHQWATVLFLGLPFLLMVMQFSTAVTTDKYILSADLDVNRKWVPEEGTIPALEERTRPVPGISDQGITTQVEQKGRTPAIKMEIQKFTAGKNHFFELFRSKFENLLPTVPILLLVLLVIKLSLQAIRENTIIKTSLKEVFNHYPVYYSDRIYSPFSTGIFFKKIFLPRSYMDQDKRECILIHELAHIQGNHNLWSLLENLVLCLNWYNPLWYLYRKNGELLKELLADESVTRNYDVIAYGRLLLAELELLNNHHHHYMATGIIKKKIINKRIQNMLKPSHGTVTKAMRLTGLTVMFCCLALTILVGCARAKQISDPDDFSYVKLSEISLVKEYVNLIADGDEADREIMDDSFISVSPKNELVLGLHKDKRILFTFYDLSGEIQKQFGMDVQDNVFLAYTMDQEGHLYVFSYDQETQSGVLKKYRDDGSPIEVMRLQNVNCGQGSIIRVDNQGTLYLTASNMLHVYKEGKRIDIHEEIPIRSMAISPDGTLYYISWNNLKQVHAMNRDNFETTQFETPYENSVLSCKGSTLLIMDTKGIKEYEGSHFKGYITSSEDYPELLALFSTNFVMIDRSIYIISWDFNAGKIFLHRLVMTDKERVPDERPSITIQMPSYEYQSMEYAAKIYNQSQNTVRILVTPYEDSDGNQAAYTQKIHTEILAGQGPDIIYLSNLPYEELMEKGVLEDLTPYLEGDESILAEDYLPAMTAAENDTGLFALATDFLCEDILFSVKESVMRQYGYSGFYLDIPWDELLDIAKQERRTDRNGMEIYPFGIPQFEENSEHFMGSLFMNNHYFLDREGETFLEDPFRDSLTIIDTLSRSDLVKPGITGIVGLYNAMEEGSTVFFPKEIDELWTFMVQKRHIFNGEPVMIVHPNCGDKNLYFTATLLGINEHSKNKEEAWKFLKTLLSKEFQEKMVLFSRPVHRVFLKEKTIYSLRESEKFYSSFSDDTGMVEYSGIAKYTDEDIEHYCGLMEKFTRMTYPRKALDTIFFEQLRSFLDGEITEDEAVAIVKERVNTYIRE